jgi:hypothetical protein
MEEKLIDKIALENGLTLEIHDRSRKVAVDRWLVSFEARIDVEVKPEYFQDEAGAKPSFNAIQKAVGKEVTYSYEKSRHFVAETEKDDVFQGLKDRFLTTTLPYLSNAKFPRNTILLQFKAAQGAPKPSEQQ